MTWIRNKQTIDTSGGRLKNTSGPTRSHRTRPPERRQLPPCYTVAEVAEILHVTKPTVMAWLEYDEGDPQSAVINPGLWFKLPNGHIRIRQAAVDQLLGSI